ncbi:DUF3322 domain-containing protein [Magnetospirillum sp. UT-4]|uniref:DUF3322 domain-containing protein n=1 Tax=Magnetospirillum sp. UT-4 TaxID=2681467 RepID=UPI001C2D708E|nr:DUF3322 domain-containing protein [Magnetospirillum sp. UT-4]
MEAQIRRLWDQGRILSARLGSEPLFPLKLRFRAPESKDLGEQFAAVRDWIAALELSSQRGFNISWREVNHRQLGRNRVPDGIEIPDETTALRLIGKSREAAAFTRLADATLSAFPQLADWLARRPLTILEHADDWPRVLAVLAWFRSHPRPGLYLRQLDIPGVDTKFIEGHKGLLSDLLSLTLPPEAMDATAVGAKGFEQRFGLLSKPPMVRFRILDPALALGGLTDLTVPAAELAATAPPGRRVFITENEVNGLSFPSMPDAIVIFGLGHGIGMLDEFAWLHARQIHYWSDIDTHGFAMLSRLRASFPHAQSFLMDRRTLLAHRPLWGREEVQHAGRMDHLTDDERALLDDLRADRLGERVRLEQERIGFRYLTEWLNGG